MVWTKFTFTSEESAASFRKGRRREGEIEEKEGKEREKSDGKSWAKVMRHNSERTPAEGSLAAPAHLMPLRCFL